MATVRPDRHSLQTLRALKNVLFRAIDPDRADFFAISR
jgi:hypothetical protein